MPVVLAVLCAAQFMVVLDVSVVNVALPSIQRALGFDAAHLAWVGNAYALTFGGLMLLGGRLADLYGHRRVFAAGLVVFTVAGLGGGLAEAPGWLIAARAGQGVGAAVLAPATLTILTSAFPEGARRTRAIAVWTAVSLAGGTTGNLVGGALTEFLSWRWTLLINVPIGLACLAAIRRLAPGPDRRGGQGERDGHGGHGGHGGHSGRSGRRLDVLGAVLATGGLAALACGLSGGLPDAPAVTPAAPAATPAAFAFAPAVTLVAVFGGVVLLGLFALVEVRVARAPLIPPSLLRPRAIWLGNVTMLLAGACLNPMWYFLTLSLQNVLGYGPLLTGLAFLPHTVLTMLVGLRLTPWLMLRVDHRVLVAAGALAGAAGFWWQSGIAPGQGYLTAVLGPAVLISLGGGLLNTPLTVMVTSGVAPADAGAASGLLNTAKQVGGALGLAVLVALTAAPGGGPAPAHVPAAGYGDAFAAIAVVLTAVAVLAVALPRRRDGTPAAPRGSETSGESGVTSPPGRTSP
ncbi:MFS transporter [Nonomuraea sp. NPDC049725]|uniref:MFS transporter n=1 Tax=Nonomuraea sp. NPDC049725 TaxID=3154508 RepID=UPI003422633C